MILFDSDEWKKLDSNKRGDIAELSACNHLMMLGYNVFRNVSSTGPVDIIAYKKGDPVRLIDVGVIGYSNNCIGDAKRNNALYSNKDVEILYLMPDGTCKFRSDVENFQYEDRKCNICDSVFLARKSTNRKKCDEHVGRG